QELGRADQRRGEPEPLAHALAEPADPPLRGIRQTDALEETVQRRALGAELLQAGHARQECARGPRPGQGQTLGEAADARPRPGVLRPAAEQLHAPRVGMGDAEEALDEGGLPGPVGTDEAEGLAAWNLEIDPVERDGLRAAEPGAEALVEGGD